MCQETSLIHIKAVINTVGVKYASQIAGESYKVSISSQVMVSKSRMCRSFKRDLFASCPPNMTKLVPTRVTECPPRETCQIRTKTQENQTLLV